MGSFPSEGKCNSGLDKRKRSIINKISLKLVRIFTGLKIIWSTTKTEVLAAPKETLKLVLIQTGLMHLAQASGSPKERRFRTWKAVLPTTLHSMIQKLAQLVLVELSSVISHWNCSELGMGKVLNY